MDLNSCDCGNEDYDDDDKLAHNCCSPPHMVAQLTMDILHRDCVMKTEKRFEKYLASLNGSHDDYANAALVMVRLMHFVDDEQKLNMTSHCYGENDLFLVTRNCCCEDHSESSLGCCSTSSCWLLALKSDMPPNPGMLHTLKVNFQVH